jgi:hypothetical protein
MAVSAGDECAIEPFEGLLDSVVVIAGRTP